MASNLAALIVVYVVFVIKKHTHTRNATDAPQLDAKKLPRTLRTKSAGDNELPYCLAD